MGKKWKKVKINKVGVWQHFKHAAWDEEERTVRGSFVNISLTVLYVLIIIAGLIWGRVADNVLKMETFLIGFFAVSFSIWAGKKVIENIQDMSTAAGAVTDTLQKLGIKIPASNPNPPPASTDPAPGTDPVR
jgi:hypothetical protein